MHCVCVMSFVVDSTIIEVSEVSLHVVTPCCFFVPEMKIEKVIGYAFYSTNVYVVHTFTMIVSYLLIHSCEMH